MPITAKGLNHDTRKLLCGAVLNPKIRRDVRRIFENDPKELERASKDIEEFRIEAMEWAEMTSKKKG